MVCSLKPQSSRDFSDPLHAIVHVIPDFYRTLVPFTGESPTPTWNLAAHLAFMANNSISRGILSISSPGSTVYLGNEAYSTGLARLLNEWLAELVHELPERFEFYSVTPLPYVNSAYGIILTHYITILTLVLDWSSRNIVYNSSKLKL